jgi:hypothetical protein
MAADGYRWKKAQTPVFDHNAGRRNRYRADFPLYADTVAYRASRQPL